MRILKLMLISIVVFGGLIISLSLLFPSQVRISRAINIGVSRERISNSLGDLKQWEVWNQMTINDPSGNKKYADTFFSSDQMQISRVSAAPGQVLTQWKHRKNEPIYSGFNIITAADSTIVQWYFDIRLKWYPWEKFGSIIFDKELGPPMESSLSNFKKFMENKP